MVAGGEDGEVVRLAGNDVDLGCLDAIHGVADGKALAERVAGGRFDARRDNKRLNNVGWFECTSFIVHEAGVRH